MCAFNTLRGVFLIKKASLNGRLFFLWPRQDFLNFVRSFRILNAQVKPRFSSNSQNTQKKASQKGSFLICDPCRIIEWSLVVPNSERKTLCYAKLFPFPSAFESKLTTLRKWKKASLLGSFSFFVTSPGFKPGTFWAVIRCAIQLRHEAYFGQVVRDYIHTVSVAPRGQFCAKINYL